MQTSPFIINGTIFFLIRIFTMTDSTYLEIFIKNICIFIRSLSLKKITKLFFYSLAFRSLLYLIVLIIPTYYSIIYCAIFTYILLIKPCIKSKGVLKALFSDILFIFFTIITLFIM